MIFNFLKRSKKVLYWKNIIKSQIQGKHRIEIQKHPFSKGYFFLTIPLKLIVNRTMRTIFGENSFTDYWNNNPSDASLPVPKTVNVGRL